ncbi:MAG: ribonuclease III [Lachnospiraceae bacterium]|nr:ribonuclease III [Lachnospiraceae bacterium]MBP5254014.1 ribonuclease III [Lachnospiraceae bacterium]
MTPLEQKIGYVFKDPGLLKQAMTHSSYINEHGLSKPDCNERLEFLGDALLETFTSIFLYRRFPDLMEGALSKRRAALVCEKALAVSAREIGIPGALILGKGMEKAGARNSDAVISDAFESLIAALYLDGGTVPAKALVDAHVLNDADEKMIYYDAKTALQEILQKEGKPFSYHVVGESGPDHAREFTVEIRIGDEAFGRGTARSKKQAEQDAALEAIRKLR